MGGLKLFVYAFIALLHHGKTGFLRIGDGERGVYLWYIHIADFLAHRVLAIHAVRERGPVYRAHQFKTLAAHATGALRVFRVLGYVFVYRHRVK